MQNNSQLTYYLPDLVTAVSCLRTGAGALTTVFVALAYSSTYKLSETLYIETFFVALLNQIKKHLT